MPAAPLWPFFTRNSLANALWDEGYCYLRSLGIRTYVFIYLPVDISAREWFVTRHNPWSTSMTNRSSVCRLLLTCSALWGLRHGLAVIFK